MTIAFYDRAKMTVTGTPGTGAITLGTAVSGFQSFAAAGVPNAGLVSYVVEDGTSWELGRGIYTSSGTALARTQVLQTSAGSTSPLTLTSAAVVYITALAEDLANVAAIAEAGTAHPWWRLNIRTSGNSANTATVTTMATLEFHTSKGGAQAATGGTAYASDDDGTNHVANLFDTNVTTAWYSNFSGPYPHQVAYKFPAPVSIVEVAIQCVSNFSYYDATVRDFDVQYSDDSTNGVNGTWVTAWTPAQAAVWASQSQIQTFTHASALAALANLVDVNLSTPPTDTQLLSYDLASASWKPRSVVGVPTGGATGQVLAKNSATNFDVLWTTPGTSVASGTDQPSYLVANIVKPTLSAFANTYKTGASLASANTSRGVYINQAVGAGNSQIALVNNLPSTPYTVTAFGRFIGLPANFSGWGLVHVDSSNAKNTNFTMSSSSTTANQVEVQDMSAMGSFSAGTSYVQTASTPSPCEPMWLKVQDDGTNFIYWISPDGEHWTKIATRSRTAYLTPTQVGIVLNVFQPNIAGIEVGAHVFSYAVAAGLV